MAPLPLLLAMILFGASPDSSALSLEQAERLIVQTLPWWIHGEDRPAGESSRTRETTRWDGTTGTVRDRRIQRSRLPAIEERLPGRCLLITWSRWESGPIEAVWRYDLGTRRPSRCAGMEPEACGEDRQAILDTLEMLHRPVGPTEMEIYACLDGCAVRQVLLSEGEWVLGEPGGHLQSCARPRHR